MNLAARNFEETDYLENITDKYGLIPEETEHTFRLLKLQYHNGDQAIKHLENIAIYGQKYDIDLFESRNIYRTTLIRLNELKEIGPNVKNLDDLEDFIFELTLNLFRKNHNVTIE